MTATSPFPPGTFSPAPQRANAWQMVKAQGIVESKLTLRHGEQQLLSVIFPLALLIGAAQLKQMTGHGLDEVFPMALAVAATSAGFTGQAIALAFDRRYGALKRAGASGVPAWTIIAGKIIAVFSMVLLQVVLLTIVAFIMGLRATPGAVAGAAIVLVLGVISFSALGLFLGGAFSSEVVLAVANLIWFVLLGVVGWAIYSQGLGAHSLLTLVPSVALAGGIAEALAGGFPLLEIGVLLGWAAAASFAAAHWFRFDG